MSIEEDIEIKEYSRRKKELQKKVNELDAKRKEKFEALQRKQDLFLECLKRETNSYLDLASVVFIVFLSDCSRVVGDDE